MPKRFGFIKAILLKLFIGAFLLTGLRIGITLFIVQETSQRVVMNMEQILSALEVVSR